MQDLRVGRSHLSRHLGRHRPRFDRRPAQGLLTRDRLEHPPRKRAVIGDGQREHRLRDAERGSHRRGGHVHETGSARAVHRHDEGSVRRELDGADPRADLHTSARRRAPEAPTFRSRLQRHDRQRPSDAFEFRGRIGVVISIIIHARHCDDGSRRPERNRHERGRGHQHRDRRSPTFERRHLLRGRYGQNALVPHLVPFETPPPAVVLARFIG